MKPARKGRGFASLLAVVFIALGAILATFVYSVLSSSLNSAHDDDMSKQAMLAAESGLDYLNVVLPAVTSTAQVVTTENDSVKLLAAAQSPLSGSAMISGSPAATVSWNSDHTVATITFDPVTLFTPDPAHGLYGTATFTATISNYFPAGIFSPDVQPTTPPTTQPVVAQKVHAVYPEYCVTVEGRYTRNGVTARRKIGMNADAVSMGRYLDGAFPIVCKGTVTLPKSKNGGVYLYDQKFDPPALNRYRRGRTCSIAGGTVVTFDPTDPPSTAAVSIPDYPQQLYTDLKNYNHWNTNPVNPAPGNNPPVTWTNVKITKNTTMVVTGNVTIEGVLYMEYPSSIQFGDSTTKNQTLTINGAIIWEDGRGQAKRDETLTLGRYLTINTATNIRTTEQPITRDDYLSTVLGANATSTLLNNNIIAGPQTDLVLDSGNDVVGIKMLNGGIDVENVTSAGSGNVLTKAPTTGGMVINGGSLYAHGNVTLNGNTAFCVSPLSGTGVRVDDNRFYLAFNPLTYWEPQ